MKNYPYSEILRTLGPDLDLYTSIFIHKKIVGFSLNLPPIGGGTQVDDFTKGFIKGFVYKTSSAKKWGGVRGTQTPL